VDLGCGTGEHARYLAARGWQATGIDFVGTAIDTARRHNPDGLITWRHADVTRPDQVDPDRTLGRAVGLILDVGCLHGLTPAERTG
jgi:2-polyprenyl-3-methyl-5-hydroxy-6-metoxy-1,4-benzoquinol methylase